MIRARPGPCQTTRAPAARGRPPDRRMGRGRALAILGSSVGTKTTKRRRDRHAGDVHDARLPGHRPAGRADAPAGPLGDADQPEGDGAGREPARQRLLRRRHRFDSTVRAAVPDGEEESWNLRGALAADAAEPGDLHQAASPLARGRRGDAPHVGLVAPATSPQPGGRPRGTDTRGRPPRCARRRQFFVSPGTPSATFTLMNTATSCFAAPAPRPLIVTTAASLPSTFVASTPICTSALRSHGDDGRHGRSGPTATPAACETRTHDLLAVIRHGTMPVPAFEIVIVAGVDDSPGRTPISTIGRSTASDGSPS